MSKLQLKHKYVDSTFKTTRRLSLVKKEEDWNCGSSLEEKKNVSASINKSLSLYASRKCHSMTELGHSHSFSNSILQSEEKI